MASFDPSTWYQMTESSVGLGSGIMWGSQQIIEESYFNATLTQCRWQLLPPFSNSTPGVYFLRNQGIGPEWQVAVGLNPEEIDPTHTQPGFAPANAHDQSQMWLITHWDDDDTFRIQSVANGSGYNLDVHPGNPLFLNAHTAEYPRQEAQHWMFSSIAPLEDPQFTTSSLGATAGPSTQVATPSSTSLSVQQGYDEPRLSAGAIAGIVIGCIVFTLLVLLSVFILLQKKTMRQRKTAQLIRSATKSSVSASVPDNKESSECNIFEMPDDRPMLELDSSRRAELASPT